MRSFFGVAALAALTKSVLAQTTLFINTPAALVECQPALLNFGGGTAPYFLSVLPAGQASAAPILALPDQASAGSYTWNVNLPAGTNITLQVRDGTGSVNYASPVAIQAGTSTSCIDAAGASSASAAGAGGAVATSAGSASATSAASTTAAPSSAASAATSIVTSTGDVTVTAAAGMPTSAGTSGNSSSTGNFTCTQGDLTYGISIGNLEGASLSQATRFFNDLARSQPTATNVSGTELTFNVGNTTYGFNLTMNSTAPNGTLHQQFTFSGTEPVDLGNGTILYDAFEDLTVYRNATSNETSVQYFILGCFNDQPAGLTVLSQIIGAAVTYWTEQVGSSSSNSSAAASAVRRMVKLF